MSKMKVVRLCPYCGKPQELEVEESQFIAFTKGAHAQDAFPELTAEERELFISGICPSCWDSIFADEEEE